MKPGDIICTAVLPQDIEKGLEYALQSLPYTFDRMKYGSVTTNAHLKRLQKITLGKCAEAVLSRFLHSHGVSHQALAGATAHTDPDRFDFRIDNKVIDLKSFAVPEKHAKAEFIANALALVPADQWRKRNRYHRFIFAFFAGELHLTLRQSLSDLLDASSRPPKREEIILKAEGARIFLTAAPEISECENKFRKIHAGTRCVQYPHGTRIDNMGCRISELTAFKSVVHWGGV
ncbi:MAG: hypothetical protein ACE5I1_12410 [bacterium]